MKNRNQKISRVVSAVRSLASAAAAYQVEDEHHSMSGTYDEEQELDDALKDLFPEEEEDDS